MGKIKYLTLIIIFFTSYQSVIAETGFLTVYSARQERLIKPLLDAFTKKTKIPIRLHTDKAGAIFARLNAERNRTAADLLIASDAGNLWQAEKAGLLQKVDSKLLEKNIPAHLRSPDNNWFGLSVRVRTIIYNYNLISPELLSSYQDLASTKWQGKLCLRTSKEVYNKSLVAIMIVEKGYLATKNIVRGWINNLATKVFSSDTNLIRAIAAGQCHLGLANSYYLGRLLHDNPNLPVKIFWADQKEQGVHINISGAGIIKYTKKYGAAKELLEFLVSDESQQLFTKLDFEYPANPKIKPAPLIASWGDFKPSVTNLTKAGELQKRATILMDEVGYR